ncbi:cysteine desulfurase DndA [Shumkonia mesophila]|uniref:cysteine desulfurase DndA n=1 Tax=Shumkonia mesophila TaxID=2838854 RepID=UPI002934A3B6|nr:cysteine desulfurase DndA [Shumkonia mesophila]
MSVPEAITSAIYLDHNATTPIDPRVFAAMEPYLKALFGNPSSVEHEHGNSAALAVDRAREQVAQAIGCRPQEIIFTGSCTEANNLAILGIARGAPEKRHIVTTRIEHPAVLEPVRALECEGWCITYLDVDNNGRVSADAIADTLREDTALVSVMAANNEVGTLQPLAAIGALCAARGVLFHSDLAQLTAYGDVNVERDNIHLASLSAHKAYGPKGVGALYIRSRRPRPRLVPIMYGGGHERGLRPGTLNTAAIVGMGEALQLAHVQAQEDAIRLRALCNVFRDELIAALPGALLNGDPTERLANNLSFSIDGVEPLALIRALRGQLSFSASSACTTDKIETSHVLLAMFGDTSRARTAFRIAPGRFTTTADMEKALDAIVREAHRLREMARPAA